MLRGLERAAREAETARAKRGMRKHSQQEVLFKQVVKTLQHLQQDPRHPGLQSHEFCSIENPVVQGAKVFEAYAQNRTPGAYRVFWCYGPGVETITIIAITPHP